MKTLAKFLCKINLLIPVLPFLLLYTASGQQNDAPPVIKILSPASLDTLNCTGSVHLIAEIVSKSSVRSYGIYDNTIMILGGTSSNLKDSGNNTYTLDEFVQLRKGDNIIYLNVKNDIASTTSEIRHLISQAEPFISWIVPAQASLSTRVDSIILRAELRSNLPIKNLSMNFNGTTTDHLKNIKQVRPETYLFEKTIKLQPGKNIISLSCGNSLGVFKSSRRIIMDNALPSLSVGHTETDPIVKIISPGPFDTLNCTGSVHLIAEIVSKSPVRSYGIYDNTIMISEGTSANLKNTGENTYTLDEFVQLRKGDNTIYLKVKNDILSAASEKRILISQAEPFITWIDPAQASLSTRVDSIILRAELRSNLPIKNLSMNFNGTTTDQNLKNIKQVRPETYLFEKTIKLQPGKNIISLSCENSLGVTKSSRHIMTKTSTAPSVSTAEKSQGLPEIDNSPRVNLISPLTQDTVNNSGLILINAVISSRDEIEDFHVFINKDNVINEPGTKLEKKDSVTYLLFRYVPLQSGANTIFVQARNSEGSGNSPMRKVFCHLEPLITWITPEPVILNFNSGTMLVKAEIITGFNLSKVKINVNGNILSIDKENLKQVDNNKWVLEKSLRLDPGPNYLVLLADNVKGSGKSAMRQINYVPGEQAEIGWIFPSDLSSDSDNPELQVSAKILSKSALKSSRLYISGVEVASGGKEKITQKNQQEYQYDNTVTLKPGVNTIRLTTWTDAGTITSEERVVTYTVKNVTTQTVLNLPADQKKTENQAIENKVAVTGIAEAKPELNKAPDLSPATTVNPVQAPLVTWVSPSAERYNITDYSVRIKARVNSTEKLQSVMVYVNGTASNALNEINPGETKNDYLLEKAINLNPGENNIYIVATNSRGTVKSDLRYLINPPTTPPVVSWANPTAQKTASNAELVMIEACIQSATELKSVTVIVNGIKQGGMTFFDPLKQGDCNYRFTNPVILKEGENSIYILAENFAGGKPSEARIIKFEKTEAVEKRLALVFGNADYGSSTVLKNPVNDANLMEATLKSLKFDVIKKLNATKAEMESSIREFSEKLPEYNVALFYYAGHGVQVGDQNYLIPVDAKLNKPTDCEWEAVEVNKITHQFEQVTENTNIIILDACRDNPFRSWTRGGPSGFRPLNAVSGTFVAFATTAGSGAADGSGSNGVYTEELVKQMVIAQSIFNVFMSTRKEVMKRTNGAQRPQEWNMLNGDFFFKK